MIFNTFFSTVFLRPFYKLYIFYRLFNFTANVYSQSFTNLTNFTCDMNQLTVEMYWLTLLIFFCRLLSNPCVSLSSEVETPTFYQTLAGVTHLEEQDICELEKCFWAIQSNSISGHLDFNCLLSLVCPPVPSRACRG